jgi:hypothetical protein
MSSALAPLRADCRQGGLEIARLSCCQYLQFDTGRSGRQLRLLQRERLVGSVGRVPQNRDLRGLRHYLLEHLQLLADYVEGQGGGACDVAAWMGERSDEP